MKPMNFAAVRGKGNPNVEGGDYQRAISVLYAVTRFLCILKSFEESQYGDYDISVAESEIGERLTDNEDLIGVEVLPIAELFAGDYACLDFRENKDEPTVCVWSHDNSEEFAPVTYKAADSFSEFIDMLKG